MHDGILAALDAISLGLATGDYAIYRRHCDLPLVLVDDEETQIFRTDDDLRASFSAFARIVARAGIAGFRREVERVHAIGDTMAEVTFRTTGHFRDGTRTDPFTSVAIMRLAETGPRLACVMNPLWGFDWVRDALAEEAG